MSYMVELDLAEKRVLVVGGGRMAEAHTEQLLVAGARPRVVAPELTTGMSRLVEGGGLPWEAREVRSADLEDAWLILALTDDVAANEKICREADARGKLAYGDSDGYRGNVGLPAVLRRGSLVIGIQARVPHLARQILLELEEDFGPEWTEYATRLDSLRDHVAQIKDAIERQRIVHRLTSPAVLALVRSGDTEDWQGHLAAAFPEKA